MSFSALVNRNRIRKRAEKNCELLEKSNKTFEDIYNMVFSQKGVAVETEVEGQSISYSFFEINELIEKAVKGINFYIKQKDGFIALHMENRVEWIVLFWAILKSGNKPYLVNLNQPIGFTSSILATLKVKYVLSFSSVNGYEQVNFTYDTLMNGEKCEESYTFADEIALSTSGTTLNEKICIYSGKEFCAQLANSSELYKRDSSFLNSVNGCQKVLAVLPLYHIFGLEAVYLWFTVFAATVVFVPDNNPKTLVDTIKKHQVTHVFAVPMLFSSIEKSLKSKLQTLDEKTADKIKKAMDISLKIQGYMTGLGSAVAKLLLRKVREQLLGESVQFLISGGSHIKTETLECINALGYHLVNGYGMTEIGIASVNFEKALRVRLSKSIGRPFSSVEFKIGENKKLFVRGRSVCKKIIINGKIEENNEWFDTGDLAEIDSEGCYYLAGRNSDLVIGENGENINPQLVEDLINLPSAEAFSVIGDKDNRNLMLIIQFKNENRVQLQQEVDGMILELPPMYQFKKILYTLDNLTDGKDIKISRTKLRNRIFSGTLKSSESLLEAEIELKEESKTKKELREILAFALGKEPYEVTDNGHFLNELGGTSLDYMTVICEIEEKFNITLNFEESNYSYSLNDLCRIVEEKISE